MITISEAEDLYLENEQSANDYIPLLQRYYDWKIALLKKHECDSDFSLILHLLKRIEHTFPIQRAENLTGLSF